MLKFEHKKKELRKEYERKRGEKWVKWIENQPTYSLFEWVEYICKYRN